MQIGRRRVRNRGGDPTYTVVQPYPNISEAKLVAYRVWFLGSSLYDSTLLVALRSIKQSLPTASP